ncbi:MAG: sugar transferase [Planctomycetota bacterium]
MATTMADLLCVLAALSAGGLWADSGKLTLADNLAQAAGLWGTFTIIWLLIAQRLGANSIPPSRNLAISLRRTLETWAATWGIAGLFAVSFSDVHHLRMWMVLVVGVALLTAVRIALSFTPSNIGPERLRAVVIGACPSARALSSSQDVTESVQLMGFVPLTNEDDRDMPHLDRLGSIDDLGEILRTARINLAFVSPSDDAITGEVHHAIDTCEHLGLQTQYFPSFLDVDDMRVGLAWSANRPGLNVQAMSETSLGALTKRAIDVVGASVGILMMLPVFTICALAVKLTSSGPVLYRQTRVGKSGRTFSCLKFRTMRVGAEKEQEKMREHSKQDGPALKVVNDPRITSAGHILRKFSLDELPQLFNVLLGDMSLVGPRPPIPKEVEQYTWWQRRRISIKPGLTCIWQVYGRNRVSFKRWVEMDLYYIDNWSLWMDIKLILHTVRVVLRGTGM